MIALSSMLLALAPTARAQAVPEIDAQLYRLPVDAERTLWTDDAGLAPDNHIRAKLGLIYTNDPLVYRYKNPDGSNTGEEVSLLSDAFQADLVGAWSYSRFRIGLDLPVYLATASGLESAEIGGAGLGDIALDVKGVLLARELGSPIGIALGGRLGLPTATVEAPLGAGGVGYVLQLIADAEAGPILFAANLGTVGNPETALGGLTYNDQFLWRTGAGLAFDEDETVGLSADFAGRVAYGASGDPTGKPVEGLWGGWARVAPDWVLRAGAGTGLSKGIGAPDARVIASFGYEPPSLLDQDKDGIVDRDDACKQQPEDKDNWEDADGCPDPTVRLQLSVVDTSGRPVPQALVKLQTETGIKELGASSSMEIHPGPWAVTADAPGYASYQGSITIPRTESHEVLLTVEPLFGTLVLRVRDPEGRPLDALFQVDGESPLPVEKGRGTAEIDVGEHEIVVRANGYRSERVSVLIQAGEPMDALVTLQPAQARVTRERIEITDKIYFETNKATIKPESFQLLNDVAAILLEYPEIQKIRVEGHTDQRGNANYNRDLSQRRSDSVRQYLLDRGVDAARIESVGHGEDKPVDTANNAAAWEINRRVEFMITDWKPEAAESSPEQQPGQ